MKKNVLLSCSVLTALLSKAQVPIEENQKLKEANGTLWYANPWLWIAGIALFLLIFVLLLRRSTRNKAKNLVLFAKAKFKAVIDGLILII